MIDMATQEGTSVVFMFPGQTSRDHTMLARALAGWPGAARIIEQASEVLGRDLYNIANSETAFARNRDVQALVFLTSHLHMLALQEAGIQATCSLGLSLGEYNHLVHIGAVDFFEALKLVDYRGQCYEDAPRGKMLAVMPLEREELQEYVAAFSDRGIVEIANYNAPSQHVIAGEADLVDELADILEDEAMAMCFPVDDVIAMHTHVMDPVAEKLSVKLADINWNIPGSAYHPGVEGGMEVMDPEQIAGLLTRHVNRPVYFYDSLQHIVSARQPEEQGPLALIEVGPLNTLSNMVKRFSGQQVLFTDLPDENRVDFDLHSALQGLEHAG